MSVNRRCGSCTACCVTHQVDELKKTRFEPCKHCNTSEGCKIYESRPSDCRTFVCQWLMGDGLERDRPDISGVVVDYLASGDDFTPVVAFWEYTEGKLNTSFVWETINLSLKSGICCFLFYKTGVIELFLPLGKKMTKEMKKEIKRGGINIKTPPILLL